jgi:hypothetical protein
VYARATHLRIVGRLRKALRNLLGYAAKMRLFIGSVFLVTILASPLLAQTSIPQTIADSVGDVLRFTEGQFLSIAEAMPEEKYSFIPTAGNFTDVRTFAEQVKHVACSQFAFFNEIEGKKPPESCERGGPSAAKTKAGLIGYLRDSFDYGNKVLAAVNAENALERVEGRYGGPSTRLGIAVTSVWHIADHYGQLVEYLRMNGIVPPTTQKYGLKIR